MESIGIVNKTFTDGAKHKAVVFSVDRVHSIEKWSFSASWGYLLWGLDIWVGRVPMIKLMVVVNIVNMALMWVVR